MTYSRVGEMSLFQNLLHPFKSQGKAAFAGALAVLCCCLISFSSAKAGPAFGDLRGFTRSAQGTPLPGVQVLVHCVNNNTDLNIVSNNQGAFLVENLRPGRYELRAAKEGLASTAKTTVDLRPQEDLQVDMTLDSSSGSKGTAKSSLTADLRTPAMTANSDAAPLTDREKMLLERLDRLEERLEAMEAKEAKTEVLGPKPAVTAAQTTTVASVPKPNSPTVAASQPVPDAPARTEANSAAAPAKHTLLASLEDAVGVKSAEKPLALPVPLQAQAPAAPAAPQHVLPEALEAPDPSPPNSDTVYSWADYTWLNGTSRNKDTILDTKYFTPEVRFDTHFMDSFNQPKDHTMGGATESFRSGEFQVEQASVGGDFHWQNVRGRILTMFGLFAATTPRNDASFGVGEWDVRTAYRYVSEAYGGYHFNVNRGLNVDAGIFVSYIGLFSYYNFDNWAYQPSYVSSNTPWFFNGLRIQWFPTKKLKIEPWLINGWQTYNLMNSHHGYGGQILWRPTEWLSLVLNNYGNGTDTLGNPGRTRIHTDDSIEIKYFDHPKSNGIDKMAFSLTGDLGCEYGGGVSCSGDHSGHPKQAFLGWMGYDHIWWGHDKYAITYGGGKMNNPGRYLTLLPPINGADAVSGSPYFTGNPGDKAKMWDTTLTFQWMPKEYITWWLETGYRSSNVPYFTGRGGITPPGGNTGSPQYYVCSGGGSAGTSDLPTAEANCGGGLGSVWFPDMRKTQGSVSAGVMVKF
jgi:hypothetical protein